ncbi:MAG: hypothetical protein ACREYC_01990 [Gammaproteobacteria bacterium]
MGQQTGRRVPLSLPRRWIDDLMAASRGVPLVTFERRMALAPVVAARASVDPPPSWVLLFTKAYAIVAARRPELRRAYVSFPWPHLYAAAESTASVAVERNYHGEPAVFFGLVRQPDTLSLADLMAHLDAWKHKPVDEVATFRQLIRYTRLPRPVRWFFWWHGMHSSGRRRAKNFGTFAVSVTAGLGAAALNLISPLATTLSYGVLSADGSLDVRLHFDHRVLDGAPVARTLEELEDVLRTELVAELHRMAAPHLPPIKVDILTAPGG